MKKIVASLLTLTLTLSVAVAVSAAPNVSGKVTSYIGLHNPGQDSTETKVNLDGKLENNIDYNIGLKQANTGSNVYVDQASFTFANKLGSLQAGRFDNNPSVMDLMDTRSAQNMKAPFVVKATPNIGKNIAVSASFMPKSETNEDGASFGAGAYQIQASYKLPIATVGVTYQDMKIDGQSAGLLWQVQAQPMSFWNVYGEFGRESISNDTATVLGTKLTLNKLAVTGEYDMKDEIASSGNSWMTKVSYNFTKNLSAELRNSAKSIGTSDVRLIYNF